MPSRPYQVCTAWVCLAIFTLTSVLMPRGFVMCRDSHGTRFELGCDKSVGGHCDESFAVAHTSESPVEDGCDGKPCEDSPVRVEMAPKAGDQPRVSIPAPTVALAIPVPFALPEPVRLQLRPLTRGAWMPPPAASHLRTIVLLV